MADMTPDELAAMFGPYAPPVYPTPAAEPQTAEQFNKALQEAMSNRLPRLGEMTQRAAAQTAPLSRDTIIRTLQGLGIQSGVPVGALTKEYLIDPALSAATTAARATSGLTPKALAERSLEGQSPQVQAAQSELDKRLSSLATQLQARGVTGLGEVPKPYEPAVPAPAPPLPTLRPEKTRSATPPAAAITTPSPIPTTEPLPTIRRFGAAPTTTVDANGEALPRIIRPADFPAARPSRPSAPPPVGAPRAQERERAFDAGTLSVPSTGLQLGPVVAPSARTAPPSPAAVTPSPASPPLSAQDVGVKPSWVGPTTRPATLQELIDFMKKQRQQ